MRIAEFMVNIVIEYKGALLIGDKAKEAVHKPGALPVTIAWGNIYNTDYVFLLSNKEIRVLHRPLINEGAILILPTVMSEFEVATGEDLLLAQQISKAFHVKVNREHGVSIQWHDMKAHVIVPVTASVPVLRDNTHVQIMKLKKP